MTIIFGNVVRSNWLLYIVLLYFWGQRIWGEEVHFGDVPFKNFISFQKGNLLIYIILVLIFFVFTSEMTSLLSSILWSSPNLVPTAPPPIFPEKPWGRGWSSPSRGVEGWGGGGRYMQHVLGYASDILSLGLRRLATENVIGEITTEHGRI